MERTDDGPALPPRTLTSSGRCAQRDPLPLLHLLQGTGSRPEEGGRLRPSCCCVSPLNHFEMHLGAEQSGWALLTAGRVSG